MFDFHNIIDKKIYDIRSATSSAAAPVFTVYNASPFDHFESVDVDLVTSILMTSPAKQCLLDPQPDVAHEGFCFSLSTVRYEYN